MAAKRKAPPSNRRTARRSARTQPSGQSSSATHTSSARWSRRVTAHSDAMELRSGVFKLKSAPAIARSLKKYSEASQRRKSTPFRSAMSMLNFEINRAGKNLTAERLQVLNQAKVELRKVFGRLDT